MARKLRSDEAEVFSSELNSHIPTEPEAFLQGLINAQEESMEGTLPPQAWTDGAGQKPLGS